METLLAALAILLATLVPTTPASAQTTCPVTQSSPNFTAGGSVFGRVAGQWNAYFRAKADANNGVLCNPTIVGPTYEGAINLNCGSLSDSGTACPANTGSSGHTLPFLDIANSFSGQQTFASVIGTSRTVSGTTDVLSSSDCGKTIIYTAATAVTVTTFASVVSGVNTCSIALLQEGAGAVSIADGSGATHVSARACTKTSAQYATMGLFVHANSPSQWNILGDCAP